ncbi:hypothetical protein L7F22_029542 [Adiantum nelumboides]|nr:hypothetical protein [Adiantum nelumboides]
MGNDFSCINSTTLPIQLPSSTAPPYITRNRSRPLITIVSPLDGRACRFKEPLNVGELMLEVPGQFVAEFGREQDGYMLGTQRISALPADSNLCALHVYYVLPRNRLNTRLANHEVRKIVMATRLAPPCSAPYPAQMQSSKITPLPFVECEEAVMRNTKKQQVLHRRQVLTRRATVRARTYRCDQVLEKDKMQIREQVQRLREIGGGSDDHGNKQAKLVLHSQRAMRKPRTWAPKLDTIMELTKHM